MSLDSDPLVKDVLYVEDHPVNALLMRGLFERRPSLRLSVASSGHEALRIAAALQPSLLLLDLRLPDCHGTALLRQLRRHEPHSTTPAIAVTAEPDFDPTGTGFLEVWTKPLNLVHVLARLDRLLMPCRLAAPKIPGPQQGSMSAAERASTSPQMGMCFATQWMSRSNRG